MDKVGDSLAAPLSQVPMAGAVDLRNVRELTAKVRAEVDATRRREANERRIGFLRRKAARLPLHSNGRRKAEQEIAMLDAGFIKVAGGWKRP